MVLDETTSHFMAWHVGFHIELACSCWNVNVKC